MSRRRSFSGCSLRAARRQPERLHRLQRVGPVPDDGPGRERLLDARQRLQLGQRDRHLDVSADSTYTLEDLNQPAATKMTITTLAGGTPQPPTQSPYDTTSGKGTLSTDLIGSSAARPRRAPGQARGERQADADDEGQAGLEAAIGPLRLRDRRSGQQRRRHLQVNVKDVAATQLSGQAFVGTEKTTVVLSAGRWTVSAPGGRA